MTKSEKKLLSIYRELDHQSQGSLIDFAEFLSGKCADKVPDAKPSHVDYQPEIAPDNESVIAAIKRLQRSYQMLDPNSLFTETSSLMSAHMVQGRPADEVIVELEALFERRYQSYLQQRQADQ